MRYGGREDTRLRILRLAYIDVRFLENVMERTERKECGVTKED
jgi:hypothetical protein